MRGLIIVFLLTCVSALNKSGGNRSPRVVIENGVLIGTVEVSSSGREFQAFKGVPYAKPPVDDHRFKEPARLEGQWIGEYNATTYGSACMQLDHFSRIYGDDGRYTFDVIGDEDCLFLNVFTQNTAVKNKPVFFFIHGGAFMFGTSSLYNPLILMDRDIVVVTINYRVGPLGFLSTGDSYVPGNNGLKDQVAALEWVQRNIATFGGDPAKVTIVGQSAGGASVHYHYLSPLSKGLFQRGVSISGTALSPWAFVNNGAERSSLLAEMLGCPVGDTRVMVKCLRRRPAKQIVKRVQHLLSWLYNPFTIFGPVAEAGATKPFLDKHPRDAMMSGVMSDLPWITSTTLDEGLYPAAEYIGKEDLLKELNDQWTELAPDVLFYDDGQPKAKLEEIAQNIKNEYFKGKQINTKTTDELVKLVGDRLFVAANMEAAILQSKINSQPVYYYVFGFPGTTSISMSLSRDENKYGVCHGDDLMYFMGIFGIQLQTKLEKEMSAFVVDFLIRFATSGDVDPKLKWEPVSKSATDEFKYFEILSPTKYSTQSNSNMGNNQFWTQLFQEANLRDEM